MRQCPECYESFEGEQNFCDIDGTPLIDANTLLRAEQQCEAATDDQTQFTLQTDVFPSNVWITVTIGILIGIIISAITYAVTLAPTPDRKPLSQDKSSSGEQLPPARSAQVASTVRRVETPSTVDELEVKKGEDESTAAPPSPPADSISAAAPERAQNSMNSGPISTGGKQAEKRGRTIIRLKDGASVEVDATWEDQQGIWYRQGGLVSFVERDRVEAITEPERPKPSPADVATP